MHEVKLPSGSILKITLSDFSAGRALYQSLLEELKGLDIDSTDEMDVKLFKDVFCLALSSKKIEQSVWKCMERCLYNNERITQDTFEPEAAREDYIQCMWEVARFNVLPFGKSLFAEYLPTLKGLLKEFQGLNTAGTQEKTS